MAKSRVAPLKQLSQPKLELMTALIAEMLSKFVREAIQSSNLTTFLWTVSQIVLYWLRSKLDTFVTNRVKGMHQLMADANRNFCPTSDNLVDLLTRGITSSHDQLKSSDSWKHGTRWLTSASKWPTWQTLQTLHLQAQAVIAQEFIPRNTDLTMRLHNIMNVTDFSTLYRLIAVSAYVLRFVENLKENCLNGQVTMTELQAKLRWIKSSQHQIFLKEMHNIKPNSRPSKRPLLVR